MSHWRESPDAHSVIQKDAIRKTRWTPSHDADDNEPVVRDSDARLPFGTRTTYTYGKRRQTILPNRQSGRTT